MPFRRPLLLALAIALVLAGCSKGTGRPGAPAAERKADAPVQGGTLRLGVSGVTSLDPVLANPAHPDQMLVIDLVFDGLTSLDRASGEVKPDLASSWSVSADGLLWHVEIDPAARFSNGRPVGATDVVWSLERLAAKGAASIAGSQLAVIDGFDEFVVAKTAPHLAGLTVLSEHSLDVRLRTPFAALPELLASPVLAVVAPESIDATTGRLASVPVGSGPWVVTVHESTTIELSRASATEGHLDGIEVKVYPNRAEAQSGFGRGEVDLAVAPDGVVPGPSIALVTTGSNTGLEYAMNTASGPLAKLELRRAVVKAVDRASLVPALLGASASPLAALVPAEVSGSRVEACTAACAADLDGAKALLAAAYPDGRVPVVHVDFPTDAAGTEAKLAGALVDALKAVGIPAEPRAHNTQDFVSFATKGALDLFRYGIVGAFPSPDAYLASVFASNGADNVTGLRDPEVDAALVSARSTVEATARAAAYAKVEARVLALAAVLPIAQYRTALVASPVVRGVTVGADGTIDATVIWLKQG